MESVIKRRGKRTSKEQMKIFVDFIEQNKIMITGKCHPLKTAELEEKWDELCLILNSESNGAKKDKLQWKHVSIIRQY